MGAQGGAVLVVGRDGVLGDVGHIDDGLVAEVAAFLEGGGERLLVMARERAHGLAGVEVVLEGLQGLKLGPGLGVGARHLR